MARWKPPTPDEIRVLRRGIADRARKGNLRFPEDLPEIRRSLGMTQDRFAALTGLTRRQLSEIESGAGNPTLETIKRIGRIFGFQVGLILPDLGEERSAGPMDTETRP
ncbi:helix-turn-helix transcriptional regulator [Aureimonas sp. AU22]|uniref:helix-turn-helix transcriptional regulator n=1 Tax=Aureimonas sp. AU22 TaxID=1638162 RepID=UPI0007849C27|nr:helix-turn-helix transcriptional regulator [Aureimonas sp. AU22]